jgi:hypothetical protein
MLEPSSSPSADLSALTFSNDNRMVRNFRNGGLLWVNLLTDNLVHFR